MKLVEKHKIYKSHPSYSTLDHMSRKANNLYNQCVYFAKNSENLSEDLKNLDKAMKSFPDEHDNYRSFGYAQCAQQILRLFQRNLREAILQALKIIRRLLRNIQAFRNFQNFEKLGRDFK